MTKKIFFIFGIIISFCAKAADKSSNDKVKLVPGTPDYETFMNKKDFKETKFAQRSWLLSAIVPTAGQFYNKKYLRASFYLVGFAGLLGGVFYCQNYFAKYSHEGRELGTAKGYAKVRDFFIAGTFLLYGINIIDAYVISKLTSFNVSKNVNVKIVPRSDLNSLDLGMKINFK